ncbi:hypothetical protein GCM10009612_51380 [Streptomyces beijiangensis]
MLPADALKAAANLDAHEAPWVGRHTYSPQRSLAPPCPPETNVPIQGPSGTTAVHLRPAQKASHVEAHLGDRARPGNGVVTLRAAVNSADADRNGKASGLGRFVWITECDCIKMQRHLLRPGRTIWHVCDSPR